MICTLLKSKSGISSISFSSNEGNNTPVEEREFDVETTNQCVYGLYHGKDWIEPSSPCTSKPTAIDSDKSKSLSNGWNASSSVGNFSDLSVKQSKSAVGRLVGRVLPAEYRDYDTQKSMARVDPAPLIEVVSSRACSGDNVYDGCQPTSSSGDILDLQSVEIPPSPHDTTSVVALDLYLFRSQYLQDPKNHSHSTGCHCHQAREQLIQTLVNSVDLNRNNSSRVGFENTESKSTALHDNVFHLHMNRSAKETGVRTLRRLEVSTTRKLKEMHPGSRKNKEENLNSVHGDVSFCKVICAADGDKEQRDGLVVDGCNEEEDDDKDGYKGYKRHNPVDVSGMSSGEMWYHCSNAARTGKQWNVALALPSFIIPWKRNDVNENKSNNPSASSSDALSPSSRLEWVKLDIVSNPPTLLSIQTFENFTAHLFTGVPIVLQTTVLYATHTIITWFVDEDMVLHNSNVYTPAVQDEGKRLSVLVTPIRPGHNGDGCQEAYSFTSLVEPLPTNPIVELRENWIHRKCEEFSTTGSVGGRNRLRVVTVSSDMSDCICFC
jgi:hypothetical protein